MKRTWTARRLGLAVIPIIAVVAVGAGSTQAGNTVRREAAAPDVLNVQIGEFATLNPFLSSGIGRGSVNAAIYMPLVFLGADNTIQPGIASAWEQSADGLTYTFTIRDDLVWSDGEPLDSGDVLWSFSKYLDADLSQWASRIGGVAGQGEGEVPSGLSAPDATTFVVELAELNPSWLTVLAAQGHIIAILPEHVLSEMTTEELSTTTYFETEPVTLGPYNFGSWERDQYVELVRNEEWPTPAAFERVRLSLLQSEVAAAQLETGELQVSGLIAPLEAARLDELETVAVETTPGVWPEVLQFNDPHFEDPRVRQAMIYALDLDGICEEVLAGYCDVTWNQVRLISPEWAIPTEGLIEYEYNPDRARELLAEAGWDEEQRITLINIGGQDRVRSTESVIIQASFEEVGIGTDILSTDVGSFLEMAEMEDRRAEWDVFINRGANFAADPNQVSPYNSCDTFYPGGANISWYCRPELDELWAQGLESPDPEARAPIYHEAFQFLNADPDVIVLNWPETIVAHNTGVGGIAPLGSAEFLTWNIGEWTWTG
jgi:peptide/nickel transport system substrate-binding protein